MLTGVAALSLAALAVAEVPASESETATAVVLDRAVLEDGWASVKTWRFRAGDDPSWAQPRVDDSDWEAVEPGLFRRGEPLPDGWRGIGWLRARLRVTPDLVGVPVALRLWDWGAAEVFLDGRRVAAAGAVGPDAASTEPRFQQVPAVVVFDRAGDHLLAVRFANHLIPAFLRIHESSDVWVHFSSPEHAMERLLARSRANNRLIAWFCGLYLAFALLHLLLFLFYPAMRANLDFAGLGFVTTGLVYLNNYSWMQADPRFFLFSEPATTVLGLLFGITLLRFLYRVFYEKTPRFLGHYVLLCVPVVIWGVIDPLGVYWATTLLVLMASVEVVRTVALALLHRKPGARILGAGLVTIAAGLGVQLLTNLDVFVLGKSANYFLISLLSFVVLLVTMSVYLSRQFATVHRDLAARLVDVERLSAEKLEEERLRREEEVERRVLETRYEEKVRELEEARELQLSMLPRRLPELPDLEVAAHMETATEVGGDYYDFELDTDGTLTVAIGDATGHGMRAGTMVTAIKGLFNVLAGEHPLLETLSRSTRAIKRMNLRKLAMALTLARYKSGELRVAAAGMPPVFVYRASSGTVEQNVLAGMPLGLMASFPYRETVLTVEAGDTVLLMSDGFPERQNRDGELLGYDRAAEIFAAAANRPAPAVVDHLRDETLAWADGHPTDDDLTFVVLKARAARSEFGS